MSKKKGMRGERRREEEERGEEGEKKAKRRRAGVDFETGESIRFRSQLHWLEWQHWLLGQRCGVGYGHFGYSLSLSFSLFFFYLFIFLSLILSPKYFKY